MLNVNTHIYIYVCVCVMACKIPAASVTSRYVNGRINGKPFYYTLKFRIILSRNLIRMRSE